ncbi:VPS27 [Candida margitis]|uniref:VPS27 n=1 Tax=Candida margitis TaxID=1775924 RepID=UPI0022280DF2|nr:VPS27 [Candida margitis]KAI5956653.1 VPS27 [Candida margitis]
MSWFGSSTSALQLELDNKISEATSETIPNGEIDLSIALEITDFIRSKKLPAQACMRSLKKRLNMVYSNPNLITSTLKLIDLCVKNGGFHFLVELSSREFIDYLIDFIFKIHYNVQESMVKQDESKYNVGEYILELLKSWYIAFKGQLQLNYVEKKYQELANEGYQFPSVNDSVIDSKYVDSEVPPDWIDSDSCMICYTPFSMLNRKHHCRACGGVFCQDHSGNSTTLVNLGIMEPVRVCDNCYAKQKHKSKGKATGEGRRKSRGGVEEGAEDEDEQMRRAIELSLQDSGVQVEPPRESPRASSGANNNEEEDEELKAALAASLREYEQSQPQTQQPQQHQQQGTGTFENPFENEAQQPASDVYNIDFASTSNYQRPQFGATQGQFQPQQQQQFRPPSSQQSQLQDLSQAEEEQINLFITLMNNVRNDPKKQANIMYDQNLNELHSQVIRLKPKVNRSLREAMNKYSQFLEMSNKLSTITRLYDQFWEQKLNAGISNVGFNNEYPSYPSVGYPAYPRQSSSQQPISQQTSGVASAQQIPYSQFSGQAPSEPNFGAIYPSEVPQDDPYSQPTEPNLEDEEEQQQPQPQSQSQQQRRKSSHPVYPTSDILPDLGDSDQEKNSTHNNNSDYVTVSLPHYPPPEDLSNDLPPQSFIRHATSNLPPNAYEAASAKYPTLDNVEEDYDRQNPTREQREQQQQQQQHGHGLNELPQLPKNLPSFELEETNEREASHSRKQSSFEPEPLIDL